MFHSQYEHSRSPWESEHTGALRAPGNHDAGDAHVLNQVARDQFTRAVVITNYSAREHEEPLDLPAGGEL